MKKLYPLRYFTLCLLCLGLVWPIEASLPSLGETGAVSSTGSQKSRSKRKVSSNRQRRSVRKSTARRSSPPRPSIFDVLRSQDHNIPQVNLEVEPVIRQIEEHELRAHVKFLADDLLEGRGTGTRGGMLAARYIAAQFEAIGLEPAALDRTYFQQVEMVGTKTDQTVKLSVKGGSQSAEFSFGNEFVAGTDVEQTEIPINTDVVFVGYGIQAPELNWDDYKGLDVRGRIVLILVNEPPATSVEPHLFSGKALTYYGRWTYKYEEATRRGAAGAILIHTNESAGYGWNVVYSSWSGERFILLPETAAPALKLKSWVTEETARKLLHLAGKDFDQLRQAAQTRDFRPVPLNLRVETTLRTTTRRVLAPNVVGILRGSDEQLKQEYLVYTAHWDHLGIRPEQPGDNIYNGAVDNATGVASLLAIAKTFASLNVRPKRSILFIATAAEEQGLLGAEYYTRHPLVPLAKTVASINLDSMNVLGKTTDITPLGADRSTLGKLVEEVATENRMTISPDAHPEQGSFYRSDHFPFAKAGIPAVHFGSGSQFVGHSANWGAEQFKDYNEHRYHQPSDEYSPSWDFSGLVQQAQLAFSLGLKVANAREKPQWNPGDEFERARMQSLSRSQ